MNRMRAVAWLSLGLFAGAGSVSADVVWSDFMAADGYDTGTYSYFVVVDNGVNDDGNPSNTTIAVPFVVPFGVDYKLDRIELVASLESAPQEGSTGNLHVRIETDPSDPTGTEYTAALFSSSPQKISMAGDHSILQQGTQYYLLLTFEDSPPSIAHWQQNSAGVAGTIYLNDPSFGDPGYSSTSAPKLPVFRILGTPVTPPAVRPAYSAFGTLGPSGVAVDATVFLEVICPGPKAQLTCPVGVHLPAGATSAEICQDLASAITANTGGCWGTSDPNASLAFTADCDGNNVRVFNSMEGLCAGAFVCVDHVDNLTKFASKRALPYEYASVGGPLLLQFRGLTGLSADPTLVHAVQVVHRGVLSGRTFSAKVSLPAGISPGGIVKALWAGLLETGDDAVFPTEAGLYFIPAEPYDVTVRVNDSTVDWALSPFNDLLARSDVNPGPTFGTACAGGANRLCLHQGRFQVDAIWTTAQGGSGVGHAGAITGDAGYFSFFSPENVELMAKIFDGCAVSHTFWFFGGGLTNVGVELTVTDTKTGKVRTYRSGLGTAFQPIQDTAAFACP